MPRPARCSVRVGWSPSSDVEVHIHVVAVAVEATQDAERASSDHFPRHEVVVVTAVEPHVRPRVLRSDEFVGIEVMQPHLQHVARHVHELRLPHQLPARATPDPSASSVLDDGDLLGEAGAEEVAELDDVVERRSD